MGNNVHVKINVINNKTPYAPCRSVICQALTVRDHFKPGCKAVKTLQIKQH